MHVYFTMKSSVGTKKVKYEQWQNISVSFFNKINELSSIVCQNKSLSFCVVSRLSTGIFRILYFNPLKWITIERDVLHRNINKFCWYNWSSKVLKWTWPCIKYNLRVYNHICCTSTRMFLINKYKVRKNSTKLAICRALTSLLCIL